MVSVINVKPYSEVFKNFRETYLNGASQAKVAKALKVRQKTISDWETEKTNPRDVIAGVRLAVLALKMGATVDDLVMFLPDPDETEVTE
jgi:DNA-binding XRE family transcriptional regulator